MLRREKWPLFFEILHDTARFPKMGGLGAGDFPTQTHAFQGEQKFGSRSFTMLHCLPASTLLMYLHHKDKQKARTGIFPMCFPKTFLRLSLNSMVNAVFAQ